METFDAIQASPTQDLGQASVQLPDAASAVQGQQLRLGGQTITLDRGGVFVLSWPGNFSLMRQVQTLCALQAPVVRYAGGALIADLSLQDNLMLEPALSNGQLPLHLLPEMDVLFKNAGCPLDRSLWARKLADQASASELMQIRVGRALMLDPDLLLVDAAQWNDDLLAPRRFSESFVAAYPWRTLVWACDRASRADVLQTSLQELQA